MGVECQKEINKVSPENADPPVYEVINGAGAAPLMIACDHGGNALPDGLQNLVSSPELMELHIAYDIGVQQVAKLLSEMLDAPALIANYSRLLVDLNRYPGDPDQMPLVSDGQRIPGNEGLDQPEIDRRLEKYFYPYHHQHAAMVENLKATFLKPIILSVHSFTPVMQQRSRPWHFGVLWERDRALAEKLISGLEKRGEREAPSLIIGDNQPYGASDPLGYAINEHAAGKEVEMALIEVRQDLLHNAGGQEWAARVIYDVIEPLMDIRIRAREA